VTYLSAVLADTPTHFWRLADPGGSIAIDIGGTQRPLAIAGLNRPPFGYTGPNRDGGSACFIHGGVPDSNANTLDAIPYVGAWSLECWAYALADNPNATFQTLLGWDGTTANSLSVNYGVGGILGATYNGVACNSPAAAFSLLAWHHVVATYDGANAKIYVDAILKNTVAIGTANKTLKLIVSRDSADLHTFEGFLAEVAVYAAALAPARVTAHFAAADNAALAPSLVSPGSTSSTTGSPSYSTPDILTILASVRKTY
jgi:hypothetical protein